MGDFAKFMG